MQFKFTDMNKVISIIILMATLYICAILTYRREKVIYQQRSDLIPADVSNIDFGQLVYVPVHSKLYSAAGARLRYMNTTLKVRNTSLEDTIYLSRVEFYDQQGNMLRKFLDSAILLRPMTTFEIVTKGDEHDGKGDNFIVEWHAHESSLKPILEAVTFDASKCLVVVNESKVIRETTKEIKAAEE